jgi:hypothetical protein
MPVPSQKGQPVADKLTTIKPTKYARWPETDLVQLGPAVGDHRPTQEVILNGEPVGKIALIKAHKPSRTILGTRLRRDLKARDVWRVYEGPGRYGRIDYTTRSECAYAVLQNHASGAKK